MSLYVYDVYCTVSVYCVLYTYTYIYMYMYIARPHAPCLSQSGHLTGSPTIHYTYMHTYTYSRTEIHIY